MIRLLAFAAALLAGGADAAVFRCDRGGHLEFSDHACEAGQDPVAVARPNSMDVTPGEARLAAIYDREMAARRQKWRSESAATEKASRLRRQNEDRIREAAMHRRIAVGMTPLQVTSILGEPSGVTSGESEKGKSETWTFRDGNIAHTVQFKDGKVSSVSKRTAKRRK